MSDDVKPNWSAIHSVDFARCVDDFVARAGSEPERPLVVLVGSNQLRTTLQRELHRAHGGRLGLWLVTFADLARKLGTPPLAAQGRSPADPLYQRALVARLLAEKPECGFADVASFDGAAQTVLAACEDLEEAGCTRWPDAVARKGRLGRIAGLFDAYRDELTAAHCTPQDLLVAAADNAADFAATFGADCLHVVGIYDANVLQMRLLSALSEHVAVEWHLPQVIDPPVLAVQAGAGDLKPFTPASDNVNIWSCATEEDEARAIIREAMRRYRGGVPYHHMGVLLRHGDVYADLLIDLCRRAGVPVQRDGGCRPREAGSLRALSRLVDLLGSRLGRGRVMSLLAAVELPASYPNYDEVALTRRWWDAVSREARVRTRDDWQPRLTAYAGNEKNDDEKCTAAGHLLVAVEALHDSLAKLEDAKTYAAAATELQRLARHLIANDDLLREALSAVQSLYLLDRAGLPYQASTFKNRVQQLLEQVREPVCDEAGLRLIEMHNARGLNFAAVFVPGCVEGQIPPAPRQDPVLLDREREEINRLLDRPGALPVRTDRARDELRLFDVSCRAATDALVLSYPRLDADKGRERLPSHLLLALASRVVGKPLMYEQLPEQKPLVRVFPASRFAPDDPDLALDDDERDLAAINALAEASPIAPVLYLRQVRSQTFERAWTKWVHRWAHDELNAYDGVCLSDPAREALAALFGGDRVWSVTEIEDYIKCPRRYLLGRILRLAEPDDPEKVLSLSAEDRGLLLHAVLENAIDKDLDAEALRALIKDKYEKLARENQTGGGVLDDVEQARVVRWTEAMVDFARKQSVDMRVVETEGKVQADIDIGGRTVRLRARLDRIDEEDELLRVVDYKSGKNKDAFTGANLKENSFNHGATLQVPLYLLAYAAAHADTAERALTAAYWFLQREHGEADPKAVRIGSGFFREKQDLLRKLLGAAVADIIAGRFAPRPDLARSEGNNYCKHCKFAVVCDARSRKLTGIRADKAGCCAWARDVGRIDGE